MPQFPEPIADRLLSMTAAGAPALLGGRDRQTGRIVFPLPDDERRFETIVLPECGNLWSWTIQRFRPKSPPYAGPDAFEPYAVGYVALGDTIIVEARLVAVAFEALRISMKMRLTLLPFAMADGVERLTYAFAPDGESE